MEREGFTKKDEAFLDFSRQYICFEKSLAGGSDSDNLLDVYILISLGKLGDACFCLKISKKKS